MGKFKTQWEPCAPLLHEIGEEDTAIPDLTYSITEMRRKFILEQELMKASAKQPQYLYPGVNDGEDDPFEKTNMQMKPLIRRLWSILVIRFG